MLAIIKAITPAFNIHILFNTVDAETFFGTFSTFSQNKKLPEIHRRARKALFYKDSGAYFIASSTATAQATVAPTIGLLPMPIRPIIST